MGMIFGSKVRSCAERGPLKNNLLSTCLEMLFCYSSGSLFCLITTGQIDMLRITELKLPLEHLSPAKDQENTWTRDAQNLKTSEWLDPSKRSTPQDAAPWQAWGSETQETPTACSIDPNAPSALLSLLMAQLHIRMEEVLSLSVFKRSFDARKTPLQVVYIVDLQLRDQELERRLLTQTFSVLQLMPAPDMRWSPHVGIPNEKPLSHSLNNLKEAPLAWQPGAYDDQASILRIQQWAREHLQLSAPSSTAQPISHGPASQASTQPRPVVVGFGPCGIFAALILAQLGLKPIVIERGKKVRERTKDTWGLWRKGILKTNSNVQFGEGGAGTFSDGKLYSQTKDPRFLGRKVMQEFVKAGAPEEILFAAHPHIGTFKLVKVVESLREQIISLGGEIRFGQQLVDMNFERLNPMGSAAHGGLAQRQLREALIFDEHTQSTYTLECAHLVLALGHSARDTFARLYDLDVPMLAKPFSIGFRIEHPQSLIDRARWGKHAGHPLLGAADYKLVHHAKNQRSVYSFCMCPGGTVVAATSEHSRVVTNGMSQYSRNERNANAAIVVGIEPEDFKAHPAQIESAFEVELEQQFPSIKGLQLTRKTQGPSDIHPLSGVVFQRHWESNAFVMGGHNYHAPAQKVGDFLNHQSSSTLGDVLPSYKPGVHLTELSSALPTYAIEAIREALPEFAKKVAHFDWPGALLSGVETRTSSPLRILRNAQFQSPDIKGLYPAGEGAGFAGGILTAAMDGIKVAEALAHEMLHSSH